MVRTCFGKHVDFVKWQVWWIAVFALQEHFDRKVSQNYYTHAARHFNTTWSFTPEALQCTVIWHI